MAINPALLAHSMQQTQPTAQGLLGGVAAVKNIEGRNKLADLNMQMTQRNISEFDANAGLRDQTRQNAAMQQERGQLFQASNEFLTAWDMGGKEAALQVVANFPETGAAGRIKQEAIAALQSPDPNDDLQVLEQAKMFRQIGMDEGFFNQAEAAKTTGRFRWFSFG